MNGKGDKLRKGANLKAYYDNYDSIFRKQSTYCDQNEARSDEKELQCNEIKKEMSNKDHSLAT